MCAHASHQANLFSWQKDTQSYAVASMRYYHHPTMVTITTTTTMLTTTTTPAITAIANHHHQWPLQAEVQLTRLQTCLRHWWATLGPTECSL